jgi:PTH2 family peptidyl-tRNA hydrolase
MKQVLIVRKDLGMRKGKMISQGAHASLMAYLNALGNRNNMSMVFDWLQNHGQTKITVGVETEEQLHSLYKQAKDAGLPCSLVLDSAKTEFDKPTYTSCAIGPAKTEDVDKITKELKLL